MEVVGDAGMQLRLVARLLLVFLGELYDSNGPGHSACAQYIHHTVVVEADAKVELLKDARISACGDFSLTNETKTLLTETFKGQLNSHLILGRRSRARNFTR